ncbi:MAG: hypothetical protein N2749_05270 [Clostridia bacterium]|nr:hypothetical protein [Clostridia bacterium]
MSFIKIGKNYSNVILKTFCIYILMLICSNIYIWADSVNNGTSTALNTENKIDNNSYSEMQNVLNNIREEINEMDVKLQKIRSKSEYQAYPAVRLNVDTPIFGIYSVTNRRLKITEDVSPADITSGYSIRDIIKSNKLKVPSFKVVSFVVITRDIKINNSMTKSDYNICINKLLKYLEVAKNINNSIDSQINNILNSYKGKDIIELKNKLNDNLNEINNENQIVIDSINKLNLLQYDGAYDYYKQSYDIKQSVDEFSKLINNSLTNDENIKNIESNVAKIKSSTDILKEKVENSYNESIKNIDKLKMLTYVQQKMDDQINYLNQYIKNSQKDLNMGIDYTQSLNISDAYIMDSNIIYNITSRNILKELENYKDIVDSKIIELSETNSSDVQNIDTTTLTQTGNEINATNKLDSDLELIQKINTIYIDFLNKTHTFILNNINFLNNKSKNDISYLTMNTSIEIYNYIEYVYSNLPNIVEKTEQSIDKNSIYSLSNTVQNLKIELNNINQYSVQIDGLYIQNYKTTSVDRSSNSR